MKHVYINALELIMRRIKSCGVALQNVSDEYEVSYWQLELAKANHLRSRLHKRLKVGHNVITVNFSTKKRVA